MRRREFLGGLILTPILGGLVGGCGSSVNILDPQPPSSSVHVSDAVSVISAEEAARKIAAGSVLTLAAESVSESGPVPLLGGAVKVDVDDLSAFSEEEGVLTQPAAFQSRFRAWGVTPDTPIIIYDAKDMKFAARVHLLLGHFGAPSAQMVNGGASALAPLLPVQAGAPPASFFVPSIVDQPIHLAFQDEVLARLQGPTVIVDVRSPSEYNGQLLLPGDARPGHIPGALNLPESTFFGPDGLLLDTPSLHALFLSAGLDPAAPILVYCHDGAKSSPAASLLVQCGYGNVSLYYLSYKDWSENFALPVEI